MEEIEYDKMFQVEDSYFWYRNLRAVIDLALKPILSSLPGNRVLDGGCGTGALLSYLKHFPQFHIFGLDYSFRALNFTRQRQRDFPLAQGSVSLLPYKSDTFALITSMDVLQHEAVNQDNALAEFHRVLLPGGYLLMNLPANRHLFSSHDVAVKTVRRYNRGEVAVLLRQHGFELLRMTYWNTVLFPSLALIRLIKRGKAHAVHVESDLGKINPVINSFLYGLLGLERLFLHVGNFPFGLSVFVVARKPLPAAGATA